ncbi:MAG: hypothetical protein ACI857_000032 [Arenicella sp.]|jgi:hypothetical protein
MSLQEKKAVFNILSSFLIIGGFLYYTFVMHAAENLPLQDDVQFWAEFMLTFMVVTIVLKIVVHIIFYIFLKIAHQDEDIELVDEYDKRIEMKADRRGNHVFMLGFVASFIPVAMGEPVYYMFLIMLISGLTGGTLGDLWKIYFYRRGL